MTVVFLRMLPVSRSACSVSMQELLLFVLVDKVMVFSCLGGSETMHCLL